MRKPDYFFGDMHLGSRGMFKMVYSKTFETIDEYHEAIVARWNKKVSTNDKVVVVFGDLGHKEYFDEVLPKLRGYKILIMGNHDGYSKSLYEEYFDEVYDHPIWIHKRMVLSHVPVPVEAGVFNIHGHTHLIKLDSPYHINICPEWWDYTPVLVKKIEKMFGKYPKPNIEFLYEWYADIQISHQGERNDLVVDENGLIDVEISRRLVFEKKYKAKLDK